MSYSMNLRAKVRQCTEWKSANSEATLADILRDNAQDRDLHFGLQHPLDKRRHTEVIVEMRRTKHRWADKGQEQEGGLRLVSEYTKRDSPSLRG